MEGTEPVAIFTDEGVRLEGELRTDVEAPRASAVICHPHPKAGGSKDHPVLWSIRNELAGRRGFAVLSFNFRGVMGSAGSYGGGHGEARDTTAAISFVRERAIGVPTLLVGWSFGAVVALRASLGDERVRAIALVGIPLAPGELDVPAIPGSAEVRAERRPTLFVTGEHDGFCPPDLLRAFAAEAGAEAIVVGDTDHYFWRRERELAGVVGEWAEGSLGLE